MATLCIEKVKEYMNISFDLKDEQIKCLEHFYAGRDVFACLKTGFGKSLIYQMTPFISSFKKDVFSNLSDITIVITPLNSIMKSQVLALSTRNINACYLDMRMESGGTFQLKTPDEEMENEGSNSEDDTKDTSGMMECSVPVSLCTSGRYQLLYAHPEAFLSTLEGKKILRNKAFKSKVCCIAIDEAHMIQEWGEEFRKDFGRLKNLLVTFPGVPVMLFTGTASKETKSHLVKSLELNPVIIEVNPDRPNIMYIKKERMVSSYTQDDLDKLLDELSSELIEKRKEFPLTIVYTDLDCIEYSYEYMGNRLGVAQYDGDVIPENRLFGQFHRHYPETMKTLILKNLSSKHSSTRLIFATIALGMGFDSPHIHRIIHFKPPTSIEKYLQETGRAGRDGKPAEAILYYNNQDVRANRPGIQGTLIKYCKSKNECLREILLSHLGYKPDDERDRNTCCSVCSFK